LAPLQENSSKLWWHLFDFEASLIIRIRVIFTAILSPAMRNRTVLSFPRLCAKIIILASSCGTAYGYSPELVPTSLPSQLTSAHTLDWPEARKDRGYLYLELDAKFGGNFRYALCPALPTTLYSGVAISVWGRTGRSNEILFST
jgi:hypothetical protein